LQTYLDVDGVAAAPSLSENVADRVSDDGHLEGLLGPELERDGGGSALLLEGGLRSRLRKVRRQDEQNVQKRKD
jgi:hypothetical protein